MSVQCHACIGGTNVGEDIRKLDYGQHVVSGTPGRVFGKLLMALFPTLLVLLFVLSGTTCKFVFNIHIKKVNLMQFCGYM